jgi:hypothetical protein
MAADSTRIAITESRKRPPRDWAAQKQKMCQAGDKSRSSYRVVNVAKILDEYRFQASSLLLRWP